MVKGLRRILDTYIDLLLTLLDPLGSFAPIVGATITISLVALLTNPLLEASQLAVNLFKATSTIILLLGIIETLERLINE